MIKTAIGFFVVILLGSLLAAFLGGIFGSIVALISPQFVSNLFFLTEESGSVTRYAFSMGMIWGLFIGAPVAGFACFLTVVLRLVRLRIEHKSAPKP